MLKSVFVLLLVYFELNRILSRPVENVSFIENINFQYKDDKWVCGDIECPTNTFGCKISLKTQTQDRKTLIQTFTCIDKEKKVLLAAGDQIDLWKEKSIDIEVETYIGAESSYSAGYGLGGHETANGVIAPDKLSDFKDSAQLNRKRVEDSNAE